jgi:hypothetical protein
MVIVACDGYPVLHYAALLYVHLKIFLMERLNNTAGCWWLIPVILATQKAEIRRIIVQSQPQANSL